MWHETHTLWDATYFGILAINENASRNQRRDYDRLEYMVCARYQCIYVSALHPSFVLERRMVLIISFANWHDAKLYRRGHWRNTVRGRGISFRFQCGNFFLASASALFYSTQHLWSSSYVVSCSLSLPHISLYEYTTNFIQFGAVMNWASMNILLHIIWCIYVCTTFTLFYLL